jgi:hypothetical protein
MKFIFKASIRCQSYIRNLKERTMKVFLRCLAIILTGTITAFGQLAEGPASGSIPGGVVVSTDSFPDISAKFDGVIIDQFRERNIRLIPSLSSADFPLPAAPEGSNYMEDPSVTGTFKSSPQMTITGAKFPISFPGIPDIGTREPPDPYIAVGPNHVMTVVNARFRISDKLGNTIKTFDAKSWFQSAFPQLVYIYDPKVHYDHFDSRWIMVWLGDTNYATEVSYYLISVSDDEDPMGTWYNWALPAHLNGNTNAANWADYPGVGFDNQTLYIVSNQLTFQDVYDYVKIRFMAKAQLYANDAGPVNWTDFWDLKDLGGYDVFGTRPVIVHGTPDEYYLVGKTWEFIPGSYFVLYRITDPLTSPDISAVHIPVTAWRDAPDAGQLGGGIPLKIFGILLTNEPVYRDSSIWLVHTVASGSDNQYSSLRYIRFDVTTNTAIEDVAFGAEGFWYFFPAITVNPDGNVAITFSRSGLTEYAGGYFTWRLDSDSPGLRSSVAIQEGKAHYERLKWGHNRWGDYSGIALDPSDQNLFWMYTEYAESPEDTWGTWVHATPIHSLPDIINTTVSHRYAVPGIDSVIVTASVSNPADLNLSASFETFDEIVIDSIPLFDDGEHHDGLPDDSLFSNAWMLPPEERHYSVNFMATLSNSDTASITLSNVACFTTIGPITIDIYEITSTDTIPSHGNRLSYKFTLRNKGLTTTAENITTKLIGIDTCASASAGFKDPAYGDLAPGEESTGDYHHIITFSKSCEDSILIPFKLEIYSNDYAFWSDTISIFVHQDPLGLAKNDENIPSEFALKQNYPNPFNPSTVINYELPTTNFVELSIYNLLGQKVATLVSQEQRTGYHKVKWDASGFASGVYYYQLKAGEFQDVKKMILIR